MITDEGEDDDALADILSYFFPNGWFSNDLETKVYYIRYRKVCNARSYSKFRWKKLFLPLILFSIIFSVIYSGAIPTSHGSILGHRVHLDEVGPFNTVNFYGSALIFFIFVIPFSVSYSPFGYVLWVIFGYFCLNIAYQLIICKYLINIIPLYMFKEQTHSLRANAANEEENNQEPTDATEHELRHLASSNSDEIKQM